jgi:NAD(P) transhydrogenase subunit alpha
VVTLDFGRRADDTRFALSAADQDRRFELESLGMMLQLDLGLGVTFPISAVMAEAGAHSGRAAPDYVSLLFVFVLATFIGLGVVARVSRLLHTPLMSLTNAISAIAVVGSIIVTGSDYPLGIRILGFVALFSSVTNIASGFLITDRMLKMFKQTRTEAK